MSSLSAAEAAFVLIGLVLTLGSLLVWALFELEAWRRKIRTAALFRRDVRDRKV